ncbi:MULTISPECIES: dienelactone hydrolase family protein [Micromonospora]|uniref:dienelactone hydrolase family protein n=1 Tax=Micromonospora TaxID=1873 RepID=UPI001B38DD46|nr:alpha/beta fold hydrolase [Micromonospora sp. M61]MBQ0979321.1 dienelactone hydrolase family protein [Micromonospora sp. M61]WTE85069.1 dienelactone hydrolase family protein [Micromonospora zamorensis]WTI19855.1 dienelactone hydrolase family protein [Micromonospora zamorensis]
MDEQRSTVAIPVGDAQLPADLMLPAQPVGVVLFAHGSGSSRHSPRNVAVARALNGRGLGTVLVDLLTPTEDEVDARTAELRFDIGLLASRLAGIVDWLAVERPAGDVPIGLFGASTGAAAALVAASSRADRVGAVVSRGGRPDLAEEALAQVRTPTLLLVGGLDEEVITLNERALAELGEVGELRVIPGATHLFEEPGTLEQVADQAGTWFTTHLSR